MLGYSELRFKPDQTAEPLNRCCSGREGRGRRFLNVHIVSWHTDPENPMLGLDGQLHNAYERPQQFVYSPSETGVNFLHLSANAEDDLPSALCKDVNTARPKCTVKQVTHMNPVKVFKEEKLAAKHKAASTSKKKMSGTNKPIAQETLNAFSSFQI